MGIIKHSLPKPNLSNGWKCPICETSEVRPVVLMPILGTQHDGIVECRQIHEDCLEFGLSEILRARHPAAQTMTEAINRHGGPF